MGSIVRNRILSIVQDTGEFHMFIYRILSTSLSLGSRVVHIHIIIDLFYEQFILFLNNNKLDTLHLSMQLFHIIKHKRVNPEVESRLQKPFLRYISVLQFSHGKHSLKGARSTTKDWKKGK